MKSNKKLPKAFIGFLIASMLIWMLITLSKEYTTTITLPVNYSNLPQNKILIKEPVKEIDISVKGSGFNIIVSNIRERHNNLHIIQGKFCNNDNLICILIKIINNKQLEFINEKEYKIIKILLDLGIYIVLQSLEEIIFDSTELIEFNFIEIYKDYVILNIEFENTKYATIGKNLKVINEFNNIDEIKLLIKNHNKIIITKHRNKYEYIINIQYIDIDKFIGKDIINNLLNTETCNLCNQYTDIKLEQ